MFKGITRRWFFSTILLIVVIVILSVAGLIYSTVQLFNTEVEHTLENAASELTTVFEDYKADNSTAFNSAAREYVENFRHKSEMEVMVINSTGRVVLTSTGFSYDESENMPDISESAAEGS